MESKLYQTDPDTQVLVQTQQPLEGAKAEVVLLHGLEGGGDAGYIVSMAWESLHRGFITHRFHMRTCGGTAKLCKTLYHGGLTTDLRSFLEQRRAAGSKLPIYLVGYSLGGNVGLKLAGELGQTDLIQKVAAVSVPIDLGACSRRIGEPANRLYEDRFLKRMRARLLSTGRYTKAEVERPKTLWEIDDMITAPSFGFGTAANYYQTQSSITVLDQIRIPGLVLVSKDDSFIPFEIFSHPSLRRNPHLQLLATEHGGHLGFLSRTAPRFWADGVVGRFLAG